MHLKSSLQLAGGSPSASSRRLELAQGYLHASVSPHGQTFLEGMSMCLRGDCADHTVTGQWSLADHWKA